MPKETVNQVRNQKVDTRIHIGWENHGQGVQVGVEYPKKEIRIFGENEVDEVYDSLWTENLTEEELTQLISALQKAKRKTFSKRK